MKRSIVISLFLGVGAEQLGLAPCHAQIIPGIPEPGLVMYGAVRNAANANARLIGGTLTWTVTPATGAPIVITAALGNIGGQYSYVLRVPFESVEGSATLSVNALQLNTVLTSYYRTNVTFTFGSNSYPASISTPALGYFTFSRADRGKTEPVDLTVSAPGVGVIPTPPSFGTAQRQSNGQFQMAVAGTAGQSYTLMASTNLVNWAPAFSFVCSNTTIVIFDPLATNFNNRFYRISSP
jgi:hypothetical protein